MTRVLADVDALLLDVLIPVLALPEGQVAETLSADRPFPFVRAHRWGGSAVHPEFADFAICDVDTWADDKTTALNLGETCRNALYQAWRRQTIYSHGSIASYDERAAPTEMRTPAQLDNTYRSHATYALTVCPRLSV